VGSVNNFVVFITKTFLDVVMLKVASSGADSFGGGIRGGELYQRYNEYC
jgi:hypothetical protein